MSGILGFFHRDGRPARREVVECMADALSHRGPDGGGAWLGRDVALGHQTMWTTAESRAERQPHVAQGGELVVTADARIDNRPELCDELGLTAPGWARLGDGELILRAYQRWGRRCPEHLVGDFAFAVWDGRARGVFLASDPMGGRYLSYHLTDRLLVFASEAKAILRVPEVPLRLDEVELVQCMVPRVSLYEVERTAFEGIKTLSPGSGLWVGVRRLARVVHWNPTPSPTVLGDEREYLEAFRHLFARVVRDRTRSAYPVGALLSGGLDSSSIACIAARQLRGAGGRLITASSVLPEHESAPGRDERHLVELLRRQEDLDVRFVDAAGASPFEGLDGAFFTMESPNVGAREYVYAALYGALGADGARVVLDGQGGELGPSRHGDEVYAGWALSGRWRLLARELSMASQVRGVPLRRVLLAKVLPPLAPRALRRILAGSRRWASQNWRAHSPMSPGLADRFKVDDRVRKAGMGRPGVPWRQSPWETHLAMISRARRARPARPGHETTRPFMDVRLIEFCLSMPSTLVVRDGWERYLLRAGMDAVLPSGIAWAHNKGAFSPDYYRRLRAHSPAVRAELASLAQDDVAWNYVDIARLRRTLDDLQQLATWEPRQGLDPARNVIHKGVRIIRFLHWFQRLEADLADARTNVSRLRATPTHLHG